MSEEQKKPRTVVGKVISEKMNKTIVVLVERKVKHPKYGKYITLSSKQYVHDELNQCKIDDVVEIKETRRLSKLKSWELVKILSRKGEAA